MKNERKLSTGQISLLIATVVFGLLAMLFGIACIVFDHLMEGAAIVLFDILLVSLIAAMVFDDKPKAKDLNLGTKVFTMHGIEATFDDSLNEEVDVTLMTDGVLIDGIDEHSARYRFDAISVFSSDIPGEFFFAVNKGRKVELSGIKPLHINVLAEAFAKHGVCRVKS